MRNEEAAAAIKAWQHDLENRLGDIDTEPFDKAVEALQNNVPVIRCKDCRYYNRMMNVHNGCGHKVENDEYVVFGMVRCNGNDFCSYGELRK